MHIGREGSFPEVVAGVSWAGRGNISDPSRAQMSDRQGPRCCLWGLRESGFLSSCGCPGRAQESTGRGHPSVITSPGCSGGQGGGGLTTTIGEPTSAKGSPRAAGSMLLLQNLPPSWSLRKPAGASTRGRGRALQHEGCGLDAGKTWVRERRRLERAKQEAHRASARGPWRAEVGFCLEQFTPVGGSESLSGSPGGGSLPSRSGQRCVAWRWRSGKGPWARDRQPQ